MSRKPLILKADFECANAEDILQDGDAAFMLWTRSDDAIDNEKYRRADYYAAFRLDNPNDQPVEAQVDIRMRTLPAAGRTLAVRDILPDVPISISDRHPLARERVEVISENSVMRARITVLPRGEVDVTTMYWMSVSEVMARLGELSPDRFRVSSLGCTTSGREIPLVDCAASTRLDAPVYVIAATPQSHEMGTIAVMGLIEAAQDGSLGDLTRGRRLLFLPLTNPDGNALGTCMTNAQRQNLIFGFGAVGTPGAAVECAAVWAWLERVSPAFYLEFHSYPHLDRPSFRPYEFDEALYPDAESRERGRRFSTALRAVSPHAPVFVQAGTEADRQFRASLPGRLIRDRGIPATIYKLHNRETIAENRAQARAVLAAAIAAV